MRTLTIILLIAGVLWLALHALPETQAMSSFIVQGSSAVLAPLGSESISYANVMIPTTPERFTADPFEKRTHDVFMQLLALNDPRIDLIFKNAGLTLRDVRGGIVFPRP